MIFMKEILVSNDLPAADDLTLGDRLPNIIGAPSDADAILSDSNVVVVGCGAIGRYIALHLARLKIRTLRLIDKKKIKRESLLTHSVVPQEISMPKASSLGGLVKVISPGTRVYVYDGPVEMLDLLAFKDADIVILATDNQNAEIKVGQRCLWLGIPLVQAAVHGDTLVAQVRVFGKYNQAACPACGYSQAEWKALNRQTRYSCEDGDMKAVNPKIYGPPTMSVSFLCSLAADLCLAQFLKHRLGLGTPVENTILEFCLYTHKTAISSLNRNPNCPCDHTTYVQASTRREISEFSLAEIVALAGYDRKSGLKGISFKLGDSRYCEQGFCKCSQNSPLKRFCRPGKIVARCRFCRDPIYPHPFFTFSPVPAALVVDQFDCRLNDLGVEAEKWAMLRGPERSLLLISSHH